MALCFAATSLAFAGDIRPDTETQPVATFSIVARDSVTGELGVAVASRFFAVGSVVPWAKAGVGAIATQAYANTTFGPNGLELLGRGVSPEVTRDVLLHNDIQPDRRQFGIVAANGAAVTHTGEGCTSWAGGRSGPNYAVQGNILTGEDVVLAMENAFLTTEGTLADRLYAALLAGESKGGDSRGKQSAAILVVKERAGYGGFNDRAIDVRVDDHPEPFKEIGRLLTIAQMNYAWNEAWTLFTEKKFAESLPHMERTARLAPDYPEVLYDLTVIRLANKDVDGALAALEGALAGNAKLLEQAKKDSDLDGLRENSTFKKLVTGEK
ncbi:MAG: DUF1028 domain-containing protein [candidate division Zixibacteria bacterium]|nr:DUF1028 domain-containing protein [candidate division Zixibacteria bacterium]